MTRVHRQNETTKPWNSADALEKQDKRYIPAHKPDSQFDIDLCINCPLPEKECFGSGGCYAISEDYKVLSGKFREMKGVFDLGLFLEAQERGLQDLEIAALFKVVPRTVRHWKKKYRAEINARKQRGNTDETGE